LGALGASAALVLALGAVHGAGAAPASPPGTVVPVQPLAPSTVLVFVSGAVEHPGLYRLSASARVTDAIAAAGGITPSADPGHLPNLSALLHDGRQVNVTFSKSTSAAARLDINSAAADELAAVPGMPQGLAEAIVEYREEWGSFTSLSQLHSDLGVDPETLAGLRQYLRLVPPTQLP
jgi:competence protein ComEA